MIIYFMLIGFSQQAPKQQPPVPAWRRAGLGSVCGWSGSSIRPGSSGAAHICRGRFLSEILWGCSVPWDTDITYIKLEGRMVYFTAIIDLYSRKILSSIFILEQRATPRRPSETWPTSWQATRAWLPKPWNWTTEEWTGTAKRLPPNSWRSSTRRSFIP